MVCPPDFESRRSPELLTVEEISSELGIHLNSVKRWLAECLFVEDMPVKAFVSEDFRADEGAEPLGVLAFYAFCRLSVKHLETSSGDVETAQDVAEQT